MFTRKSRYASAGTYRARTASGAEVTATRLPIRENPPVRGTAPRRDDERLDAIAHRHLADATAFWRLCDASDAIVPDALAARDQVAIPRKEP